MLDALVNVEGYKQQRGLSDAQVLEVGDIDGSGAFANSDIQPMLDLLTSASGMSVAEISMEVFGDASHLAGYARPVPEPGCAALIVSAAPALLARRRYPTRNTRGE
jgi:hypothetical protein